MKDTVIISAVRTPVAKFQGALKTMTATQLGAIVVKAAVERAGLKPDQIDEVIMGNVVSAGLGQNPARQAALRGGLLPDVAAMTINKVCGSGLKAAGLAAQAVQTGDSDIVVAGHGKHDERALPFAGRQRGLPAGKQYDRGFHDSRRIVGRLRELSHGKHRRDRRQRYHVSRERQDAYALNSHQKAIAAIRAGRFRDEIVAVSIPQRKGDPLIFDTDEAPRADATIEALRALKPAFKKDGTVTAGNAPGVNDGAAALVVTSAERAASLGRKPMARIVGQAVSGIEPALVMMAPVKAVRKLVGKIGWNLADVDLIELNEAFSVQAVAVMEQLELDERRVNVNGGAVALGHPIGASGARILVTLLYEMTRRNAKRGIATLCLGGGNAVALAVERP